MRRFRLRRLWRVNSGVLDASGRPNHQETPQKTRMVPYDTMAGSYHALVAIADHSQYRFRSTVVDRSLIGGGSSCVKSLDFWLSTSSYVIEGIW